MEDLRSAYRSILQPPDLRLCLVGGRRLCYNRQSVSKIISGYVITEYSQWIPRIVANRRIFAIGALEVIDLPVRSFSFDRMQELLDFVESKNSWGDQGRELGRSTFEQALGQPGLDPASNCLLLESNDRLRGYCLVHPEPAIERAVLEMEIEPELAGGARGQLLLRGAIGRAKDLGAKVLHLCRNPFDEADFLLREGFTVSRAYWDMLCSELTLPTVPTPPEFTIRSFGTGDAPILTQVQNAAFSGSWGFSPNTVEQIDYRTKMPNSSPEGILFISDEEQTVGYCWTNLMPVNAGARGIIGMIGVVPAYRGKGISRPILLAGMEYLRSFGVVDIGLEVDGQNDAAIGLYKSVGFQKQGELHWFELDLS